MNKKEVAIINEHFGKLKNVHSIDSITMRIDQKYDLIYLKFPKEDDEIEIEKDDFLGYFEEIESLKINNDYSVVSTDTIVQRVLKIGDLNILVQLGFFRIFTKNDIQISIKADPVLVGIAATKLKEYSNYAPPCSSYYVVELVYSSSEVRLSFNDEELLIKSFLFEIAHSYKFSFSFSTFRLDKSFDEEIVQHQIQNFKEISNIEEYNYGMDLFVKANQSLSADLKFLSYYKIFEYFAPICSKIEAFDAMRNKLDSSNAISPSANFISSIFDLVKAYDESLRDKELIKSLINITFDLVDIYLILPYSIRKKINKEELTYDSNKETIDKVSNELGNILYHTRNEIVHAKSNFTSSGLECKAKDLDQLNIFMHKACYSTIKWYNRLPKHLKLT